MKEARITPTCCGRHSQAADLPSGLKRVREPNTIISLGHIAFLYMVHECA